MRTNADCTIYRLIDRVYKPTPIIGVMWQECKGYNTSKTGSTSADSLRLFIPMSALGDATICLKDIVVRGIDAKEYTSASEINAYHDARIVTAVDRMDYGSPAMWHLEVSAR